MHIPLSVIDGVGHRIAAHFKILKLGMSQSLEALQVLDVIVCEGQPGNHWQLWQILGQTSNIKLHTKSKVFRKKQLIFLY